MARRIVENILFYLSLALALAVFCFEIHPLFHHLLFLLGLIYLAASWYLLHRTKGIGYLLPFLCGYSISTLLVFAFITGSIVTSTYGTSTMLGYALLQSVAILVAILLFRKRKGGDSQHWGLLVTRASLTAIMAAALLIIRIVKNF